MALLSFALDIGTFFKVARYHQSNEELRAQTNKALCTIERVFLAALGYFILDRVRDRVDLLEFRALVCSGVVFVPESYPAIAIYAILQGIMQIKHCGPSSKVFCYGVLHLVGAALLDKSFNTYLAERPLGDQSHGQQPPLVFKMVVTAHERTLDKMIYLITMVRWRSLNRG